MVFISGPELIIAGSRDRNIYTWKCPLREMMANGTSPPPTGLQCQTIEEPDKTIEGHTLGVTALAVNNGNTCVIYIYIHVYIYMYNTLCTL